MLQVMLTWEICISDGFRSCDFILLISLMKRFIPLMRDTADFEYLEKGFLNYPEYVAYCIKNKLRPLKESEVEKFITQDNIKFESCNPDKELFHLLSDEKDEITLKTLLKATDKLGLKISLDEAKAMIEFYGKDKISFDTFMEYF